MDNISENTHKPKPKPRIVKVELPIIDPESKPKIRPKPKLKVVLPEEVTPVVKVIKPKPKLRTKTDILEEAIPDVVPVIKPKPKHRTKTDILEEAIPDVVPVIKPKPKHTTNTKYVVSEKERADFHNLMTPYVCSSYEGNESRTVLNNLSAIQKHIKMLHTELIDNLHWNTSIYILLSESDMSLYSFVISGPNDTPYDNGLFHFSMSLPMAYPKKPPLVNLLSTNMGTYRINPNLYANGKVCLSLLGTWEGPGWRNDSNILEVLLAIQAQIFVDNPLGNEPGSRPTKTENTFYNFAVRAMTIKVGMIDIYQNPPEGLEEMCISYFTGPKKQEIVSQLMSWKNEIDKYIAPKTINRYLDCLGRNEHGNYTTFDDVRRLTHKYADTMIELLGP